METVSGLLVRTCHFTVLQCIPTDFHNDHIECTISTSNQQIVRPSYCVLKEAAQENPNYGLNITKGLLFPD